jgi:hypothetical protein
VGCFAALKKHYYSSVHSFMKISVGQIVNRYNIGNLICRAYSAAMTPSNIISSFRKTGIFPCDKKNINSEFIVRKEDLGEFSTNTSFLNSKLPKNKESSEKKKSNKKVSVGGMAITEGEGYRIIFEESLSEDNEIHERKEIMTKSGRIKKPPQVYSPSTSPQPGPSGLKVLGTLTTLAEEESMHEEVSDNDNDNCCVCGQFSPPKMNNSINLNIVDWAMCCYCSHWVHLRYCHKTLKVKSSDDFFCPCCEMTHSHNSED